MELFRHRKTGEVKSENEWFHYFKGRYSIEEFPSWRDFREQLLISSYEEDVDFALGLGMNTIILGQQKIPLKGIRFKGRDYVPPTRIEILYDLRKYHFMIGAEMGRSNLVCLDYDDDKHPYDPSCLTWTVRSDTLICDTPHGVHLFFWNDVFYVRIPKLSSYQGPPFPIGHSRWLKEWTKENPLLLDNLISETDITRIRNEISWIPPSETPDGLYQWREPRRLPMLFSELLISLSKGRR